MKYYTEFTAAQISRHRILSMYWDTKGSVYSMNITSRKRLHQATIRSSQAQGFQGKKGGLIKNV